MGLLCDRLFITVSKMVCKVRSTPCFKLTVVTVNLKKKKKNDGKCFTSKM